MDSVQLTWLQNELRRIEKKLDELIEKQKKASELLDEPTRKYGQQIGSSGIYGEKHHSEK